LWKQRDVTSCETQSSERTIEMWRGFESRRVDASCS
jgi:hypothetical protein